MQEAPCPFTLCRRCYHPMSAQEGVWPMAHARGTSSPIILPSKSPQMCRGKYSYGSPKSSSHPAQQRCLDSPAGPDIIPGTLSCPFLIPFPFSFLFSLALLSHFLLLFYPGMWRVSCSFWIFFLPSVFTRYSMLIVPHLDGYFWCVCRRRWAQRLTPPPSSYLPFVYFGKRILVTFFSAEPIWKILLVHFKCTILCLPAPISPSILLKLGSHKSVLHVCESGSILQTC